MPRKPQPTKQSNVAPAGVEFLTPVQVAFLMQVKEITVRLWLRRKLIRGVKIGHSWRIHRSEVDRFRGDAA